MSEFNAANRKHIRVAEKASKEAELREGEVIIGLMSTAPGRRWVHDLLSRCHCFHQPFTGDALTTAFGCGEMNIGQQVLMAIMRYSPDDYIQMMKEQNERHIIDDNRRGGNGTDSTAASPDDTTGGSYDNDHDGEPASQH